MPWRTAWLLLGATVLALLLLHVSTIRSLARVWTDNESFSHCWFVAPLAAYMIWTRRAELAELVPRPSIGGVLLTLVLGGVWFLAHLAQVSTGEQIGLVGMLVGAVWALLGTEVCRRIAYPLAFLALMVPFGEGLFPILINVAGRLGMIVLDWTGMPVTFDGRFLRVPGGEWTITEACSGLRYLLTILTVGAVFAYVNYRRPLKRALFLGVCVVAAVLTNGFRVWLLVVIGSLTNMQSPLVNDHVWLGWLLFAIMLFVIFQIGRRMADHEDDSVPGIAAPPVRGGPSAPARSLWVAAASVIVIAVGGTAGAAAFDRPIAGPVRYTGPVGDSAWEEVPYAPWDWKPIYPGATAEFQGAYDRGGELVGLFVGYYRAQRQGAELIGAGHGFVYEDDDRGWKRSALTHRVIEASGRSIPFTQVDLEAPGVHLRVWRTYWVGGRFVAGENQVKLEQLRSKLAGRGDDAAVVMIYTGYDESPDPASGRLGRFLSDRFRSIERSLWYTSGRGPSDPPAG
jgi:exosortase A